MPQWLYGYLDVYRFSVIFSRDKMVKGASLWPSGWVVAKIRKFDKIAATAAACQWWAIIIITIDNMFMTVSIFRFSHFFSLNYTTTPPSILKQITNRDYEVQVPVAFPSKLIVRDQINWLVLGDIDHLGRVERIPLCYLSDKTRKTLCICIYIIW